MQQEECSENNAGVRKNNVDDWLLWAELNSVVINLFFREIKSKNNGEPHNFPLLVGG